MHKFIPTTPNIPTTNPTTNNTTATNPAANPATYNKTGHHNVA